MIVRGSINSSPIRAKKPQKIKRYDTPNSYLETRYKFTFTPEPKTRKDKMWARVRIRLNLLVNKSDITSEHQRRILKSIEKLQIHLKLKCFQISFWRSSTRFNRLSQWVKWIDAFLKLRIYWIDLKAAALQSLFLFHSRRRSQDLSTLAEEKYQIVHIFNPLSELLKIQLRRYISFL